MSAEAKPVAMVCPACNRATTKAAPSARATARRWSKTRRGCARISSGKFSPIDIAWFASSVKAGWGQVYEAQHVNINKRFALKLLRPEIVSNGEAVARFRQEAWSASSIGHENIIEIEDFATLPSGAVYLAMEFLDGVALSERMRRSRRRRSASRSTSCCRSSRARRRARKGNRAPRHEAGERLHRDEVRAAAGEDP